MNASGGHPLPSLAAWRVALALMVAAAAPSSWANGQGAGATPSPAYTLDIAASATPVPLSLQTPGTLRFNILRTASRPARVNLSLSEAVTNQQNERVHVRLRLRGETTAGVTDLENVTFDQPSLPVELLVPQLPAGTKVTVRLTLITLPPDPAPVAPANAPGPTGGRDGAAPEGGRGREESAPSRFTFVFELTSIAAAWPATLVIDQTGERTLEGVRPVQPNPLSWVPLIGSLDLWTGTTPPTLTLAVRERSGALPLFGVRARLDGSVTVPGPGLDLSRHVVAQFNGHPIRGGPVAEATPRESRSGADHASPPPAAQPGGGIFAAPPDDAPRNVPEGDQATINLIFRDLPPGPYVFPLRFGAANSGDDEAQKLTVKVNIRQHAAWAVLVLFVGALASFLGTKVVTMLRKRAVLRQQLRDLRPDWDAHDRPNLPEVALRAKLSMIERLSRRFWLTGATELETGLAEARRLHDVLKRWREVRHDIAAPNIRNEQVRRRADWRLKQIESEFRATPLTDADVTRVKGQLDKLAEWRDSASDPSNSRQQQLYWEDLRPAIDALLDAAKPSEFPDMQKARDLAEKLYNKLAPVVGKEPWKAPGDAQRDRQSQALSANGSAPQPEVKKEPPSPTLDEMTTAEDDYGRLEILRHLYRLWKNAIQANSQRDSKTLNDAITRLKEDDPIIEYYKVIDEFWWKRLKSKEAELTLTPATSGPHEAYDLIPLVVRLPRDAHEPTLEDSYLVQHKLTWTWEVTRGRQRWYMVADWLADRDDPGTPVRANSPVLRAYSPYRGSMHAKVTISYPVEGKTEQVKVGLQRRLEIRRSGVYGIFGDLAASDFITFGVALTASIASGLITHALKPTFFGTFNDYLTLFIWAAGIDQTANFLRSLNASNASTPGQGGKT